MGLFSFIKNTGAKVFGIGKTVAEEKAKDVPDHRKAVNKALSSPRYSIR